MKRKKINLYVWRRRIIIALIAAISSFLIGISLPWNQQDDDFNLVSANQEVKQIADNRLIARPNETFKKVINQLQQQARDVRLTFSIPKQFQGKTIEEVKVDLKEKVIALTFDDGPYPQWSEQILAILKKNNIKGTFFWIGRNLKSYPEIAQKTVAEGHAIGNHTWSHNYKNMSPATAAREIEDTSALIYKTTGVKTSLFRPPGGFLNNGVASYAKKKKYIVAMWSADSIDYSRPSVEKLVNNIMRDATPGGMVLMHDGGGDRSNTVKALPIVIQKLRSQGYRFVTVPELLELEGKQQPAPKKPATTRKAVEKPFIKQP